MEQPDINKEILRLYNKLNCKSKVAKLLKITRNKVRWAIERAERDGEASWLAPGKIPEHMKLGKATVQRDASGNVVQDWVRLEPQAQAIKDFVEQLCEQVQGKGKAPKRRSRKTDSDDLLFEIDIFDPHVGMYADEKETLDSNYDCDIAAKRMVEAVESLASRAVRPKKCVLVFGGDCLHSDNRSNKTELSGNVLDVDTRYQRVIAYLIAASRECVQIAASIAETVEIHVLRGNHSWHSEAWLAQVLSAYYSSTPNVEVKITHSPRSHFVWGKNFVALAHGDRIPANKWPLIIASEFAKEWGATKYRYLRCGHIHTQKTIAPVVVDEQSGLLVEYCPALCPSDAWHSDSGYVGNQRGASGVEYHKEKGRITSLYHIA